MWHSHPGYRRLQLAPAPWRQEQHRHRSCPCLSHPQSPQVDDRMNGDGTGRILGINDPTLFWVIAGVFTTVWAIYYVAGRDLDQTDNVSAADLSSQARRLHAG